MKLLLVCMMFLGVILIIVGFYKQKNKVDIPMYKSIMTDNIPQNKGLNLRKYYSSMFSKQTPWASYPINNTEDLDKWEGKVWGNSGWDFTQDKRLIQAQITNYEKDLIKLKGILEEADIENPGALTTPTEETNS